MRGKIIRKLLVIFIVIIPVFTYSDCKKQKKCGCNGDILYQLTMTPSTVYFSASGGSIYFSPLADPYSTYYFCNPSEMFSKLADAKSGDILQVTGKVFWDCSYVYQSSNYNYGSPYKTYQVVVTDVISNLYGKK